MKKILLVMVMLLTLSGCGNKTYDTLALNFEQKGEDYALIPDENATSYNTLIEQLETSGVELNSETPIAVVATSTANVLDSLGMNIVGVTSSKSLNDNLQAGLEDGSIADLGSPIEPNLEAIAKLDEDLVFVGSNMPHQAEYESIDNLIILPQEMYYDIFYTVYALITQFNLGDEAKQVFNEMVITDQKAKQLVDSEKQLGNVAILKYAYGNVTIAPDNTYAGSLLTELNIDNMYGDMTDIDVPMSIEKLLTDNPDIIILYGKGEDMQEQIEAVKSNEKLSNLTAYQNDQIYTLQSISLNADIDSANTLYSLSQDIYGPQE